MKQILPPCGCTFRPAASTCGALDVRPCQQNVKLRRIYKGALSSFGRQKLATQFCGFSTLQTPASSIYQLCTMAEKQLHVSTQELTFAVLVRAFRKLQPAVTFAVKERLKQLYSPQSWLQQAKSTLGKGMQKHCTADDIWDVYTLCRVLLGRLDDLMDFMENLEGIRQRGVRLEYLAREVDCCSRSGLRFISSEQPLSQRSRFCQGRSPMFDVFGSADQSTVPASCFRGRISEGISGCGRRRH